MSRKRVFYLVFLFAFSVHAQNFWTPVSNLAGGDFVQAMTKTQSGSIIAASWYVGIYRSTNSGASWVQSSSTRAVYDLSVAPDGNIYALHYTVHSIDVSRSTDDGVTWNSVYTEFNSANYSYGGGIAYLQGGVFVAVLTETVGPLISDVGGAVLRSTNSGANWLHIFQENGPFFGNLVKPLSGTTIYAAVNGIGNSSVIFTTTQGSSWVSSNIFGAGGGERMAIDTSDNLYVGVWTGDQVSEKLYKSTNGGNNWFPAGLPGGNVLSLYIASNGNIYSGTDAFAPNTPNVRRSTNGSQTWEQVNSGLPAGEKVYSFTESSMGDIFAGTHSSGIYVHNHITGITPISGYTPDHYRLGQNFPNPFNPSTKIRFDIPAEVQQGAFVKILVYDINGREEALLVNEKFKPGEYEVTFDGRKFSSGIYFYHFIAADFSRRLYSETKKMVLIK